MSNYQVKTETDFWGNDRIVIKQKMTAYEAGSAAGTVIGSLLQAQKQNAYNNFSASTDQLAEMMKKEDYETAYQYTKILLKGQNNQNYKGSLLTCKAECGRLTERYEEALIDINNAIELLKNNTYTDAEDEKAGAAIIKGKILVDINNIKEGIEFLTKGIQITKSFQSAFHYRGIAFRKIGNFEQALKDINQALAITPNVGKYYLDRGLTYEKIKDYPKAISDFEQAAIFDEKSSAGYRNKGLLLAEIGKHHEAIVEYDKAIERDPNYSHNYLARAKSYRSIGQEKKAEGDELIIYQFKINSQKAQAQKEAFNSYIAVSDDLYKTGIRNPPYKKFAIELTTAFIGTLFFLAGIFVFAEFGVRDNSPILPLMCSSLISIPGLYLIIYSLNQPNIRKKYNNKYLSKISEIEQQKQNFGKFYEIYLEAKIKSKTDTLEETTKTLFAF